MDRHGRNVYGTERIRLDPVFSVKMDRNMKTAPFLLDGPQRGVVELAIREVCFFRRYSLVAINVRTNHVHTVISAGAPPNSAMRAFKANATRRLQKGGLIDTDHTVWERAEAQDISGSRAAYKRL